MDFQQALRIGWRLEGNATPFTDPSPAPHPLMARLRRLTPLLQDVTRRHNGVEIICPTDPSTVEQTLLPDWARGLDGGVQGALYEIVRMGSLQFALATMFLRAIRQVLTDAAADYVGECHFTLHDIASLWVPLVLLDPPGVVIENGGQRIGTGIGVFAQTSFDQKDGWHILASRYPDTLPFSDWANAKLRGLVHDSVAEQVMNRHLRPGPAN